MKGKARTIVAALSLSAAVVVSIAGYEGYRGDAYKDAVGVPTIGFGETKGVKMGQKTTPERALVQLLVSAENHADGIRKCINVPLYQHEFDAYASTAYNIGVGAFCRSTIVKRLNASDYTGACEAIKMWDKAGGKTLPGLTRRRQSEYQMCMGES